MKKYIVYKFYNLEKGFIRLCIESSAKSNQYI